jgi:CBS domain-containing protein
MKVSHVMTSPAVTVYEDDRIVTAARLMEEYRIGSVIVVDDDEQPVGIVTDRDIVARGIAYDVPLRAPVTEIMSHRLFVIYEDEEVGLASYFMGAKQVKRLVVLDNQNRLAGVLSLGDIATTEYNEHAVGETVARITYPYSDWGDHPHFGTEVDDFRL